MQILLRQDIKIRVILSTSYRFEIIADSNLQTMMVDRLLRLRPEMVSTYTVGSMQSRVLGISTLRSTITSNLIPILTAYLSVIFNFVYLSLIHI